MMYVMDTTTMKALVEHREECLARSARRHCYLQPRSPRRRLAAMLRSIALRSSGGGVARARTAEGCSTDPAAAA